MLLPRNGRKIRLPKTPAPAPGVARMEDREPEADPMLSQCLQAIRELAPRYIIPASLLDEVLASVPKAFEIAKSKGRTEPEAMEAVVRSAESVFNAAKNKSDSGKQGIDDVPAYYMSSFRNRLKPKVGPEEEKTQPLSKAVEQSTPVQFGYGSQLRS